MPLSNSRSAGAVAEKNGKGQVRRLVNWVYSGSVLPLTQSQQYRGFAGRLQRYEQLEAQSLSRNRDYQWSRLKRLLEHAYGTSPFYRDRLNRAGIRLDEVVTERDFRRIPILSRDEIRESLPEMRSRSFGPEEVFSATTGGTTDTPVPIVRDLESLREKSAVQWSFSRWAGFEPGDKVFYLWGARQDFAQAPNWRWRLYDRRVMRRIWAPTSHLNEEVLESYRKSLDRFRPRVVYAYPTPLSLFCEYLQSSGRPYWRPHTVISTAESLLPHQRELIERVMECPVFERYATREFGTIAADCERQRGMHLNPAAAYVEQIPVRGTEENLSEVVVTDLLNYAMPLIRYRINDCVIPDGEVCDCGRGYPLLGRITGRTADVFWLANGDAVPGVSLTNRVLQVCPGLRKIQVTQWTTEDFEVKYVPGPAFADEDLGRLRANLIRFFPADVRWTFEPVSEIEREKSGKTRFCISRVKPPAPRHDAVPATASIEQTNVPV
jgi:phenylacetate-CoA ligase